MNWGRVWAVCIRHLYVFRKNFDRLSDSFYWPVLDIILWGLTSAWVERSQVGVPHFILMLLTGLVYWQVVWRANYEISVNLLEEMWNANLVNLFSTPLKLSEWIAAAMLLGLLKLGVTVLVGSGAVYLLYQLNIFSVGYMTIPFFIILTIAGWTLGFIGASFIIYWGQKVQTIAWTMGFLLAPFSAVYYPLDVLPSSVQAVSRWLPTTYVFEGMRFILATGTMPLEMLGKAAALTALYLSLSIVLFVMMFEKSRAKGLARLE